MNKEKGTLFEDFIEYCKEDNTQLAKDIQCWLCDYFDLPNRQIKLEDYEIDWINGNLTKESQIEILGYLADGYNKRWENDK